MSSIKDVVVLDPKAAQTWQSFYLDKHRKRIKPNLVLLTPPDMTVYFQTNSMGFKGPEIDHSKTLVASGIDFLVIEDYLVEKRSIPRGNKL